MALSERSEGGGDRSTPDGVNGGERAQKLQRVGEGAARFGVTGNQGLANGARNCQFLVPKVEGPTSG